LKAVCDPQDLISYLGHQFATTTPACDHTFSLTQAYLAPTPQTAHVVFQVLAALDARCDCEAFFILRMLTC